MSVFFSKPAAAIGLLSVILLLAIGCGREAHEHNQGQIQVRSPQSVLADTNKYTQTYKTQSQLRFLRVICPQEQPQIDLNNWVVTLSVGRNVTVYDNLIIPGSEINIITIKNINGIPYPPPIPTAAITDQPIQVTMLGN